MLACVLVLLAITAATLALPLLDQHGSNEFSGNSHVTNVILKKFERDVQGVLTTTPIPGAQFFLFKVAEPADIEIGDLYTTDGNGWIVMHDVAPGEYYFLEYNPPSGYTFDTDASDNPVVKYSFTVTGNESGQPVVVTAYNRRITGSLIIEKTVANANSKPLSAVQQNTEFAFTVAFSDEGTYRYTIDGGAAHELASGATLLLKHGQRAIFSDIPTGVIYTVVEADATAQGYTTSSIDHQGSITEAGRIARFTNTAESSSLTITKIVNGNDADPDQEFEFTVTIGTLSETIKLRAGQSKTYDDLVLGTPYSVTEADYSTDGYITTPTSRSYSGTVSGTVALPFVNTYDDETDDPGALLITKTVSGENADPNQEFEFTVTIGMTSETIHLKDGESRLYENIAKGTPYTVVEATESDYSTTIKIGESVIAANEIAGAIASGFTDRVEFINTHEELSEVDLTVRKLVEGDVPAGAADTGFHFKLEIAGQDPYLFTLKADESVTIPIPQGAAYSVTEIDITGPYHLVELTNGSGTATGPVEVTFTNHFDGPWLIDITGEKTWVKTDSSDKLPAQIELHLMDGTLIIDDVIVTPDATGKWLYTFTGVPRFDSSGNEIAYTIEEVEIAGWKASYNGYNIANSHVKPALMDEPVRITKKLTGTLPASSDTFAFKMTALNGGMLPGGEDGSEATLTIAGAGSKAFTDIPFYSAGTFTYEISEIEGSANVTYDKTVYTMTVVVEQKASGELEVVSVQYCDQLGKSVEGPVFTNAYRVIPSDKVTINGTKTWKHGTNDPKNHPSSINVMIKDGEQVVAQHQVTAADNWSWSIQLDKYRADGSEIGYTIVEEPVAGYTASVNGFNITNTYNPASDPSKPGPGRFPLTGDHNLIAFWLILLVLATIPLVVYVERKHTTQIEEQN